MVSQIVKLIRRMYSSGCIRAMAIPPGTQTCNAMENKEWEKKRAFFFIIYRIFVSFAEQTNMLYLVNEQLIMNTVIMMTQFDI